MKQSKIMYGALTNDRDKLLTYLAKSDFNGSQLLIFKHAEKATHGLNELLATMRKERAEIAVLVHHDVTLPFGWENKLRDCLAALPDTWGVAGVWGCRKMDQDKVAWHGNVLDVRVKDDMGRQLGMKSKDLPSRVDALDEVCLVVKLSTGFEFPADLEGWDLYGTYVCLWMETNGFTAWAIDNALVHHCDRPWDFEPGEQFLAMWNKLKIDFPGRDVLSTVYLD